MKADQTPAHRKQVPQPDSCRFMPFQDSSIWEHQQRELMCCEPRLEAALQERVATPAVAAAYAATVVAGWRDALDAGRLDLRQPLVIVELMAGNGRFAAQMLNALRRSIAATPLAGANLLYLLSDARPERLSACWNHPKLWRWFENGVLDTACFDPVRDRHLSVESRRLTLGPRSLANPLTVLANGVFSAMPQAFYHAHFGKCYAGHVDVNVSDDTQFNPDSAGPMLQIDYDWREAAGMQPFEELLSSYVRDLDSTPLLFPIAALTCLDRLAELCCSGMLVMSADRGFHAEQQLRIQGEPEFGAPGRFFLPVNGHVMARYATLRDGAALQVLPHDNGVLYQAMTIGAGGGFGAGTAAAFDQNFVLRNPGDYEVLDLGLERQRAELSPDQMLSCLRLSHWNHNTLALLLPYLLDAPLAPSPGDRLRWIDALEHVWDNYFPIGQDATFVCELGLFATTLGAWGLGRDCFRSLIRTLPDDPVALSNLALCCLHTERRDEARRAIAGALALQPECETTSVLCEAIDDWSGFCEATGWYDPGLCDDGELSIHPLGPHHAQAALHQLRDLNIAVQTCLPAWRDENEFIEWLFTQRDTANQACCAVIHELHGFVGMVNLRWHGDDGFFYFWIGADYQHRGLGPRAARLLLRLAGERLGLTDIYTCVFRDNRRSQKALAKLGFARLPFSAAEPDEDALFYRWGAQATGDEFTRLGTLLGHIDSPIAVLDSPRDERT